MKTKFFIIVSVCMMLLLTSCSGDDVEISTEEFVLTTGFDAGNLTFLGVSGKINGIFNPVLHAESGQTITVTLINGGYGDHTFSVPELKIETEAIMEKGEVISDTFTLPNEPGECRFPIRQT